nr:MAG TPA: hypothetical protein [Bacteriophage sp.]
MTVNYYLVNTHTLEYKLKGSHLSRKSFLTSSSHYWQGKGTPF